MKTRLVFVVLVLVVLPAAVLSLMAAHVFRNWEMILESRLQDAAASAAETAAGRFCGELEHDLGAVRAGMADCLAHGGRFEETDACAAKLIRDRMLIRRVFLFMNPWGLVYPDVGGLEDGGETIDDGAGEGGGYEPLIRTLRREIASVGSPEAAVRFTVADSSYLFTPVANRRGLYAGYEVDPEGFAKALTTLLERTSGGGILLSARGPGLAAGQAGSPSTDVRITDPLTGQTAGNGQPANARGERGGALAALRLSAPFDFVEILAHIRDTGEIARTGAFGKRLYGWGVVLLAAGILVGAALVVRIANEEIRRARARSEFVAGISHDLRTPVSAMTMIAESLYLERIKDGPRQKEFLATLMREGQRLNQLIERVLFLVRFGQDALVYHMQRMDPGRLVKKAVETFTQRLGPDRAEEKEGAVALQIAPGLPEAEIDEAAVSQVILNLLDNALKYGAPPSDSGPAVRVSVDAVHRERRWKRCKEWIRIAVADSGKGISRREIKRIFRRFYRTPGAAAANVSGVGLGLALCKHVMEAHGGWIEVESTAGVGSTFSVFLPARPVG